MKIDRGAYDRLKVSQVMDIDRLFSSYEGTLSRVNGKWRYTRASAYEPRMPEAHARLLQDILSGTRISGRGHYSVEEIDRDEYIRESLDKLEESIRKLRDAISA